MPISKLELPEFATAGTNEAEPLTGLKGTGWADGDQPPAQIFNWLHRINYENNRLTLQRCAIAGALGAANTTWKPSVLGATGDKILALEYDPVEQKYLWTGYDASLNQYYIGTIDDPTYMRTTAQNGPASTPNEFLGIVPGVYAIAMDANDDGWYYSTPPYTSWTQVVSPDFSSEVFVFSNRGVVTAIDGAPVLLFPGYGAADVAMAWCSTSSPPTVAGDWTGVRLLGTVGTVTDRVTGFATNGTLNVVAYSNGTDTYVAYAPTSAGSVSADWTHVLVSSVNDCYGVAWNGDYFYVAGRTAGNDLSIFRSTDCVTWEQTHRENGMAVPATSANDARMVSNPDLGVMYLVVNDSVGGTSNHGYYVAGVDGIFITPGSNVNPGTQSVVTPEGRLVGGNHDSDGFIFITG